MEVRFKIWSNIGHTPVTHRKGAFCDVLAKGEFDAANPDEATAELQKRMKATPYAHLGAFFMPEYPNQNTNHQFHHLQN